MDEITFGEVRRTSNVLDLHTLILLQLFLEHDHHDMGPCRLRIKCRSYASEL